VEVPAVESERISVILCAPQHPGNVGAVARAMANFGISDLRLVTPCQYLHPEARKFAANAWQLLGQATVYPDLAAARDDLALAIAATRRCGRERGNLLDSTELPTLISEVAGKGRIGLVFGREDCGLSNVELLCCDQAVAIASSAGNGSLNLAQAVVVLLYELSRTPR